MEKFRCGPTGALGIATNTRSGALRDTMERTQKYLSRSVSIERLGQEEPNRAANLQDSSVSSLASPAHMLVLAAPLWGLTTVGSTLCEHDDTIPESV